MLRCESPGKSTSTAPIFGQRMDLVAFGSLFEPTNTDNYHLQSSAPARAARVRRAQVLSENRRLRFAFQSGIVPPWRAGGCKRSGISAVTQIIGSNRSAHKDMSRGDEDFTAVATVMSHRGGVLKRYYLSWLRIRFAELQRH